MAFHGASNFVINGNINAMDKSCRGGSQERLQLLLDAACLGAGHSSAERFDAPKCHPDTRKAVIDDIMSWVYSGNPKERILWLNGPAGAGKSSIMQTISERCEKERNLISSFFFSRTDNNTGRNNGGKLIPTIAYQLLTTIAPTKEFILSQLEEDPAILTYSFEAQMKKLVTKPLNCALELDYQGASSDTRLKPHLIIIDGLDECSGTEIQSRILSTIADALPELPIHLQFLVSSRPEWEIRKAFNFPSIRDRYTSLVLDEHYSPEKDIEIYLQSEFNTIKREHPLAADLSVESDWPSKIHVQSLVERSSGQFIYASTVMKYISNDRRDPRGGLKTIIDLRPAETSAECPYAQLDALYKHILHTAEKKAHSYEAFLPIFQAMLYVMDEELLKISELIKFLHITLSELQMRLLDLHSIIDMQHSNYTHHKIRFYHASFIDFLKDYSRSSVFFVAESNAHVMLGQRCLNRIVDEVFAGQMPITIVDRYAHRCYLEHLKKSNFDDELLYELRGYDGSRLHLIMGRIFSDPKQNIISTFSMLSCLFGLDFKTQRSIMPLKPKISDVCNCVQAVMDEWCRKYLYDDDMLLINSIFAIVKARDCEGSMLEINFYHCWIGTMLEDPRRGKSFYMNDTRCRKTFKALWERARLGDGLPQHEEMLLPYTFKYLLNRIKPCIRFAKFVENFMWKFDGWFFTMWDENPRKWPKRSVASLKRAVDTYVQKSERQRQRNRLHDIPSVSSTSHTNFGSAQRMRNDNQSMSQLDHVLSTQFVSIPHCNSINIPEDYWSLLDDFGETFQYHGMAPISPPTGRSLDAQGLLGLLSSDSDGINQRTNNR